MDLYRIALSIVTLCVALGCAGRPGSPCTWASQPVSDASIPVRAESVASLAPQLTLGEIASVLGPAKRDSGSGMYVLHWSTTGGGLFEVSGSSPCAAPVSRRFIPGISGTESEASVQPNGQVSSVALQPNYAFKRTAGTGHGVS
jgi:hypothetical protein